MLFGVSDQSDKAQVAVERLKVGVLIHAQVAGRSQPVVYCLPQECQRLGAIPRTCRVTSKVVNGSSGGRIIRSQDAAADVERFLVQLLRFGVWAFVPQGIRQVVHRINRPGGPTREPEFIRAFGYILDGATDPYQSCILKRLDADGLKRTGRSVKPFRLKRK